MSNEMKTWLWDQAQEYTLETDLLACITKCYGENNRYIISGTDHFNVKHKYLVYTDEKGHYKAIEI